MKIPIYRTLTFVPLKLVDYKRVLSPDAAPIPFYSFEPEIPVPGEGGDPRELMGTGPFPFVHIEVPDECRLIEIDSEDARPEQGDTVLHVPGEIDRLYAAEAFERFAPPELVAAEKKIRTEGVKRARPKK
jgi:hypothetical protein